MARAGGLPAASRAGQPLARLVRRGVVPGVGGGTGGGMRVKSGFVFPILLPKLLPTGFLEIEVTIEARGDYKERHLQFKTLRGDRMNRLR
jgi:hypothetical protein